jgi:Fe-S oxidoreductase
LVGGTRYPGHQPAKKENEIKMPQKIDFWGVLPWGPYFVYFTMGLAAAVLLFRLFKKMRMGWNGYHDLSLDKPFLRAKQFLRLAIFQLRSFQSRTIGWMHMAMASSFFIFFLGTASGTINGHIIPFLRGYSYLIYKLVLDLFTAAFFLGAAAAAYRRFIQKPTRLTYSPGFTLGLAWISLVVFNGLVVESLRLSIQQPAWGIWSPVGWTFAKLWLALDFSPAVQMTLFQSTYVMHVLVAAGLLIFLPSLPLLHIFTSPLQIFTGRETATGSLKAVTHSRSGDWVFARTTCDLTWSELLNGDACTRCGRCQESCPAFVSGNELDPRQVIVNIGRAVNDSSLSLSGRGHCSQPLAGNWVAEAAIWACTACGACLEACPVLIDPLNTLVDLRRFLVEESRIDPLLQTAFENLRQTGNTYGQPPAFRPRWADTLQTKPKDAREEAVDYLWFIGDTAAFHPDLLEITRITARLLLQAGLSFGILYESEVNAGNDVRRAGEEGLFNDLKQKNTAAFASCQFRTIITSDPHAYNTFTHEYQGLSDTHAILHISQLLETLLHNGTLPVKRKLGYRVTYHDPCYLARFNQVREAPRRIIQATGCELVEMPHNGKNTFCCGAGGGRLWMEEGMVKARPGQIRLDEAMSLPGVTHFVTACPKDVLMFRDAAGKGSSPRPFIIKDLVELVYEACS